MFRSLSVTIFRDYQYLRNYGAVLYNLLLIICIWTNKMHKILVIRLYFLLDALHVSNYISP